MKSVILQKRTILLFNFFALIIPMMIARGSRLELFFESWTLELFIVFGLCILLIFGLMLGEYLSQKVTFVSGVYRNRLAFALLFTILITGYKHVQYNAHVLSMIVYQDERESIYKKVKRAMWDGTSANNLTPDEYNYIKYFLCSDLPNVPKSADSISYLYSIDFTNYEITSSYVVPINTEIDTFSFKGRDSYYGQSFTIKNGLKYVRYRDYQY